MPLIYFGRRSTRICMRPVSLSKGNSSNFFSPHCVHRMKRISWSSCLRLCQIVLHFLQSDSPSPLERWWITLSASHAVKFSLRERDTVALPNKLCNFFRHFLCAPHTFFLLIICSSKYLKWLFTNFFDHCFWYARGPESLLSCCFLASDWSLRILNFRFRRFQKRTPKFGN